MSDMRDAGAVNRRTLLLGGLGVIVVGAGAGAAAEWDSPTFVRLRGGCGPNPAVPTSTYDVSSGSLTSASMPDRALTYSVALPAGHRPGDGTPLVIYLSGLNRGLGDLDGGLGIAGFATAAGSKLAFVQPGFGGNTYWHRRADGRDPMAALVNDVVPAVEEPSVPTPRRGAAIPTRSTRRPTGSATASGSTSTGSAEQRCGSTAAAATRSPRRRASCSTGSPARPAGSRAAVTSAASGAGGCRPR
jgi:hypothetical protein